MKSELIKVEPTSVRMGPVRLCLAWVGAKFIYFLVRLFGKEISLDDKPWLKGPLGSDYIGDSPYDECAKNEELTVERNAKSGGLIDDFSRMKGETFDPDLVNEKIHHFYENTAAYRMDVWSQTYFPSNIALWLLVSTISRKVNQLNFPVRALDTAKGMSSEIVLLNRPNGERFYTGWYRKITGTDRVIYTGFYMLDSVALHDSLCVKVVFPMPDGNATVILKPSSGPNGELMLSSDGNGFGDVGFYRIQKHNNRMKAWRINSLRETFRVYLDEDKVLRCDHKVRFLGLSIITLHYRIETK